MLFRKPQVIKKVVHRKACVRCNWFEKHSPVARNHDSCPECRGEVLFHRGVITTITNAMFFWREIQFDKILPRNEEEAERMERDWEKSPVWLE